LIAIALEISEAELLELEFDEEQCMIAHEENGFENSELFLYGQSQSSSPKSKEFELKWVLPIILF
jgi:hypothetical protein